MADNTENSILDNGIPEITYELEASNVTTAATDKTLTADGEPADAAAVGERFAAVEEDIANLGVDMADSVKYTSPTTAPSDERKLQALENIGGVGVIDQSGTFTSSQKAIARNNIGAISVNDAVLLGSQSMTDTVKRQVLTNIGGIGHVGQSLTTEQKAQARTNIGAASAEDVTYAVKTTPQPNFSDEQKAQARSNIGAASADDIADRVRYVSEQGLTPTQKATARNNIGAANDSDVVKHTQNQGLTDDQKSYARSNIGAAAQTDVTSIQDAFTDKLSDVIPYVTFDASNDYPLPATEASDGRAERLPTACAILRYGPLVMVTFAFNVREGYTLNAGEIIAGYYTGYEMADRSLPLTWMIGNNGTFFALYNTTVNGVSGVAAGQTVPAGFYRGYIIYGLSNTLWPITT